MSVSAVTALSRRASALRWSSPTTATFCHRNSLCGIHQAARNNASTTPSVPRASTTVPFGLGHHNTLPQHSGLNILGQRHEPAFYRAIARIMDLRQSYLENRVIFVQGSEMTTILQALGAKDEDFRLMQQVSDSLGTDPTLPFREIKNGRFCFDFGTDTLRRLEKQPFTLSVKEGFKRYDSGLIRYFPEIKDDLQMNSVLQSLMLFKVFFFHGVKTVQRPHMDYSSDKWICTLFNTRTITTKDLVGEPALEGVHSDGVDHTMTVLLGSENMTSDSAVTLMHDNRETIGIPLAEANPALIRGGVRHHNFLDTLILVDNERFHSLTPVRQVDSSKRATRDMLIFFTRRPTMEGHVSAKIDSTKPHQDLAMEIPMWLP